MNKLLSTIAFLAVLLVACKKGEKEKLPSEVQTLSIQFPDPTKLIITGNISKGDYKITEYGFIYSDKPDLNKENATVVSMGNSFSEGDFSKEITNLTIASGSKPVIYARAYLVDENGTRYGKELSTERPIFEAGTLEPMYGKTEDRITIKGKFYNPALKDIKVTFSDIEATVVSVSDAEIVVVVPKGIPQLHGWHVIVNVINKGVKTEITKQFQILAHVYDFSPKEGGIGTQISFEGDNLQNGTFAPIELLIYFGDAVADRFFYDKFYVYVPLNLTSEKVPVYALIKDVKIKLPGEFTVLKPVFKDIIPKEAPPGTLYTITGENLPWLYQTKQTGKFAGKIVELDVRPDQITFKSPMNTPPGEYLFTMDAGPFSVTTNQKVTVLP